MARHYSTRSFFRQTPNELLARYFEGRGFGDLPLQIGNTVFAVIKSIDVQELKLRHLVRTDTGSAVKRFQRFGNFVSLEFIMTRRLATHGRNGEKKTLQHRCLDPRPVSSRGMESGAGAPALQVATSPLLLSLSPLFSTALHPFRDSAFAQHITLFGCLTCISDTFLAQQEVHGSVCRGQMLCLKIASEGDCYSHLRVEALVCDYQLVHASRIRLGVKEPSDQHIYHGAFSGNNLGIHREASAAGNVRRSGARGLSETSTPLSTSTVNTQEPKGEPPPPDCSEDTPQATSSFSLT